MRTGIIAAIQEGSNDWYKKCRANVTRRCSRGDLALFGTRRKEHDRKDERRYKQWEIGCSGRTDG